MDFLSEYLESGGEYIFVDGDLVDNDIEVIKKVAKPWSEFCAAEKAPKIEINMSDIQEMLDHACRNEVIKERHLVASKSLYTDIEKAINDHLVGEWFGNYELANDVLMGEEK